jgi:hypothetical protein
MGRPRRWYGDIDELVQKEAGRDRARRGVTTAHAAGFLERGLLLVAVLVAVALAGAYAVVGALGF